MLMDSTATTKTVTTDVHSFLHIHLFVEHACLKRHYIDFGKPFPLRALPIYENKKSALA